MIAVNYFWVRHEKLVYKECRDYQRRFGGEFQDILSDAFFYGFLKCLHKWQPHRGAFSTLLVRCVRQSLIKRKPSKRIACELPEEVADQPSFWERLSEDADLVIRSILPINKGKRRRQRRIDALASLDMPGERVAVAVREIREVLVT
jgi:hypothetical protein